MFNRNFGLLLFLAAIVNGDWGTPGSSQYHIQTDEGPERYFRYQTDNGQFRKERRLEDGTVIGMNAWIDAAGTLRQTDYIADSQGYRILKSKTLYVGVGTPIVDALKAAKTKTANAGILSPSAIPVAKVYSTTTTSTYAPPSSIYLPSSTAAPKNSNPLGYDHYDTQPEVYIRPHAEPIDSNYLLPINYESSSPGPSTYSPFDIPSSTPAPIHVPSNSILPPFNEPIATAAPASHNFGGPIAVYANYPAATTYRPYVQSSTPKPFTVSSTSLPKLASELLPPLNDYHTPSSTPASVISSSSSSYDSYISSTTERPYDVSTRSPIRSENNDIVPLFNRNQYGLRHKYYRPVGTNELGDEYNTKYPYYDDVSSDNNGFKYFLPKQYHEEQNIDPDHRVGSFGYVDPFGIRRVTYYNTSPEKGIVIRKNNHYVGHTAPPYDPQPIVLK